MPLTASLSQSELTQVWCATLPGTACFLHYAGPGQPRRSVNLQHAGTAKASSVSQYSLSLDLAAEQAERHKRSRNSKPAAKTAAQTLLLQENLQHQVLVFAKNRQYEQASQTVQLLVEQDISLDERAVSTVLEGLCRNQQFRKAWTLYTALPPTVILGGKSYWLLLQAALQAKQPQQAVQIFKHMQDLQLPLALPQWCHFIDSLARVRQKGACSSQLPYQFWNQLCQSGVDLDAWSYVTDGLSPSLQCFNVLLKGYAQSRQTQDMEDVLVELRRAGLAPSRVTYNTMLNGYVQAGELEQVNATVRQAREAGALDVRSYTTLIKGCVMSGRLHAALTVLEEMSSIGMHPNAVTYSTVMEGYAQQGNVAICRKLVQQMIDQGLKPNAVVYNILLRVCSLHPRPNLAAAGPILEAMAEHGIAPGEDTINTLMQAALQASLPAAVPGLFRQLLKGGLQPSSVSYTILLTALTRIGRPADAVHALKALQAEPSLEMEPPTITAAVDALAHDGRMMEAEELLQRHSTGNTPAVQSVGALVDGYVLRHSVRQAVGALGRFCSAGGKPDTRMVDAVVGLCLTHRDRHHAVKVAAILEKAGANVNKARLDRALAELSSTPASSPLKPPGLQPVSTEVQIERLKFWVGLPNKYYSGDDWSDAAGPGSHME